MRKWFVYLLVIAFLASLLHSFALPSHAATSFNGTNSYIIKSSGVADIDTTSRTVACWVNVTTASTITAAVFFHDGTTQSGAIQIQTPASSGWRFRYAYRWSGATSVNWQYATDLSLTTWIHLAVTYDRSDVANDPILYVNGAAVTSGEASGPPSGSVTTGTVAYTIGSNVTGIGQFLNGAVAEVGYWDRILTPAEIESLGDPNGAYAPDAYPNGLQLYLPLYGNAPTARELTQGANGTLTNSPGIVTHPRIIQPFAKVIRPREYVLAHAA